MAKYARHDPRNKKKDKHKTRSKMGRQLRIHRVGNEHSIAVRE
jgi:hypothetical protein